MRRLFNFVGISLILVVAGACATSADIEAWNRRNPSVRMSASNASDPEVTRPTIQHPTVRSFEAALALPEAEFDLALTLLLFAQEYGAKKVDVEAWLTQLDNWSMRLYRRIERVRDAERRLSILCAYIHDDLGFEFDGDDPGGCNPDNLMFDRVLARRKGYCVTLSMVYLVLARGAGLDLFGARLPGHFIVMAGEGESALYLESTARGRVRERTELFAHYRMSSHSVETGVYLRPLADREIFSTFFNNLGGLHLLQARTPQALSFFDRAVALSSHNIEARYNRARTLARGSDTTSLQGAMAELNAAIAQDPNFYLAYCARANVYHRGGETQKSRQDLMRARGIFPELPDAWLEEAVIWLDDGDEARARQALEHALMLAPDHLDSLSVLLELERKRGTPEAAQELEQRIEALRARRS